MFALTAFVTVALPSCGGGDDDDTNTPATQPDNKDNKPTVTDPEGTQDMALKVGNAQSVINGATRVDAQYNLTGGMIASLGKVEGLGSITSIPKAGWQTSVPVSIGAGYVIYNEETEVFCRIYIVGQDGEGYHVKYQVPFRGVDEELMFSSSDISFPAEGGTRELTIANSSIIPFTVSSSEEWCKVEKIQPGTGVRITSEPSIMGYTSKATITLKKTVNDKGKTLTVSREGLVHNAVDLGVSVQWCDRNVGATSIEGLGSYFAWGETEPKETYYWDTYVYGSSKSNVKDIGMNISGTQYDAATKQLGEGWRMPTRAEVVEMKNKCTWEKTSINGVEGYRATAPNGKSIFFANVGGRTIIPDPDKPGKNFYGWTANRSYTQKAYADEYYIAEYVGGKPNPTIGAGEERDYGLQVRAVKGQPYSDAESHYTKSGTVSGHDYVDLGLSVKWATCNLEANNPWDYGDYYAWTSSKSTWGSSWRMPTKQEMEELLTCKIEWTIYHGTGGYRVTGPNGKSIFLPASGMTFDAGGTTFDIDEEARYWSSTYSANSEAYELYLSCNLHTYSNLAFHVWDSKTSYRYPIRLVTE